MNAIIAPAKIKKNNPTMLNPIIKPLPWDQKKKKDKNVITITNLSSSTFSAISPSTA